METARASLAGSSGLVLVRARKYFSLPSSASRSPTRAWRPQPVILALASHSISVHSHLHCTVSLPPVTPRSSDSGWTQSTFTTRTVSTPTLRLRLSCAPSCSSRTRTRSNTSVCQRPTRILCAAHMPFIHSRRPSFITRRSSLASSTKVQLFSRLPANLELPSLRASFIAGYRDWTCMLRLVRSYGPLNQGLLSGKIRSLDDIPADHFRKPGPRSIFTPENFHHDIAINIVDEFAKFGEKHGATSSQLALAWLLAQGEDIMPIPG